MKGKGFHGVWAWCLIVHLLLYLCQRHGLNGGIEGGNACFHFSVGSLEIGGRELEENKVCSAELIGVGVVRAQEAVTLILVRVQNRSAWTNF